MVNPEGYLEDQAMRAVSALHDVAPADLDLQTLLIIRSLINGRISKAMEAQNKVAAE